MAKKQYTEWDDEWSDDYYDKIEAKRRDKNNKSYRVKSRKRDDSEEDEY